MKFFYFKTRKPDMLQSPPLEGGFGIFVVIACIITYGSQPVGLIYALGIAMGWW